MFLYLFDELLAMCEVYAGMTKRGVRGVRGVWLNTGVDVRLRPASIGYMESVLIS